MKNNKTNQCDGCCYKEWHNGDISKCNYLQNNKCIINEFEEKIIIKNRK